MTVNLLFPTVVKLSELADGQEGDFYVLMTVNEELKTRDDKPYVRVGFRDAVREVTFPLWSDGPWIESSREWRPGEFYKIRGVYRESEYGPQLEIQRIRAVVEADHRNGFDPDEFQPRSRFDPAAMYEELAAIVEERVTYAPLRELVVHVLETHRDRLLTLPAASRNHHAFLGGWIEHVLSVTRTCVYLAEKYADYYPDLQPPLNQGLVVAGAVLHDIGKLRELRGTPRGCEFTPEGQLIGHVLQGRDLVREAAAVCPVDDETLLRLEHVIVSHQRLPEWGSPKPPMTPEALIVHYADDLDAKFHMMVNVLRDDKTSGPLTSKKNPLRQFVYRGEETTDA